MKEFQSAHPPLKANGVAEADTQAAVAEALTEEQDPVEIARKLFNLGGTAFERHKFGHAYAFFTRAGELTDARASSSRAPSRCASSAAAARRRSRSTRQYLATGGGTRDADAQRRAARAADAEADRRRDRRHRDRQGRSSTRAARCSRRTTTPTRTTSSRRRGELADRPGIVFSRAQALRRLGGRREEAIALYEQYLATGGGTRDADARAALAELRTPEATGDEAVDTATAKGIFNKGGALFEAGDYGHAYDEFTRASELADRPGILFSRAQALRKLGGREDEAMALYQQYIDLGEGTRLEDAKQMLELLRTHGAAPN